MNQKSYLSIEEIVSLPLMSELRISDDGQKVAYVRQTVNWNDNKYIRKIWIYDKRLGKATPLTGGQMESTYPSWSPDSSMLAFLSPVGEGEKKKQQIFVKFIEGTEFYQISYAEEGVESFRWAPDAKGFYYLSQAAESEGMKKRKEIYGDFEYVDKEYRKSSLYYLDLAKGLMKTRKNIEIPKDLWPREEQKEESQELAIQLTDSEEFHIYDFDISPDGKQVVFNTAPSPNQEDTEKMDLYLLNVETREKRQLEVRKPFDQDVLFSLDGKKICYTRYIGEEQWYNNLTIEILDLESGEVCQLALDIDENVTPLRWTERGLFVEWKEKTNKKAGLVTEEGKITLLVAGDDCFAYSVSITKDGQHLAYLKGTSTQPVELYLDEEMISEQWKLYEGRLRSQKQVIRWNSLDGTEIEGVFTVPANFDPTKRYPLLVVIHGGPTGTSLTIPTMSKTYPLESFVEKGFIILEPNYRGSGGYGDAFRKLNYRNLGTGDYADVISGVDYLLEQGYVDNERIGVMGWSQGGYISAFCATYSDRFKAISVGAGISDWMTYYVNTDVHQFTRMYLGDVPWKDAEIYQKTSPMTYINSACTPTLIQHGDHDQRVPVPNAFELYQGLRDVGVEVELVLFKGMGHTSRTPGIARAIMKQNLIWFCHYLLGESMKDFYLVDTPKK